MPKNLKFAANVRGTLTSTPSSAKTAHLVTIQNQQAVTTSLHISEFFGKPHGDVLKSIRALECSELFRAGNFSLSCYSRKNGNVTKTYPMYYIAKDGFVFLAMGFTGKIAAKFKEAYINAFNEMEEMLRKQECTRYAEKLFKKQVEELNKRLARARESGRKRHGIHYGGAGDLLNKLYYLDGETFERNLANIFAQVNNSFLDAYFFVSERYKLEDELKQLKRSIAELAQRTGLY